jgi:hypothetical protein
MNRNVLVGSARGPSAVYCDELVSETVDDRSRCREVPQDPDSVASVGWNSVAAVTRIGRGQDPALTCGRGGDRVEELSHAYGDSARAGPTAPIDAVERRARSNLDGRASLADHAVEHASRPQPEACSPVLVPSLTTKLQASLGRTKYCRSYGCLG